MSPDALRNLAHTMLVLDHDRPFRTDDLESVRLLCRGLSTFFRIAADKEQRLGKELAITDELVARFHKYFLTKFEIDILRYPRPPISAEPDIPLLND